MKFGVCGGIERIKSTKEAGFDYIECRLNGLPEMSDLEFDDWLSELKKYDLPCETGNCLFPWSMRLTGNEYDEKAVIDFFEKMLERASKTGVQIAVFGSGGQRRIPDDFDYAEGVRQLRTMLREIASPLFKKYGIKLAIEPLNRSETNVINTVREGTILAATTETDNIYCLADNYHMVCENEDVGDIILCGANVIHAHISNPKPVGSRHNRIFPMIGDGYDCEPFIEAMRTVGCERISIEAGTDDFDKDIFESAKLLLKYR